MLRDIYENRDAVGHVSWAEHPAGRSPAGRRLSASYKCQASGDSAARRVSGLAHAYGSAEPDYPDSLIKEPNPLYESR